MLGIGLDSRHDFRRRNRLNCMVEACRMSRSEEGEGGRAACTVDMRVVQTFGACPKYIQVRQAEHAAWQTSAAQAGHLGHAAIARLAQGRTGK